MNYRLLRHLLFKVVKEESDFKKIKKVTLDTGDVSFLIPSYFEDCYRWDIKKEIFLIDSSLEIIIIKALSFCRNCKNTFSNVENKTICHNCKKDDTYLLLGRDIIIKEIEVK